MNQRIKELKIQACKWASENAPMPEYENVCDKKFAELIIRECLNVLNPDNDLTSLREEYGRKLSMRLVEEHFGIK